MNRTLGKTTTAAILLLISTGSAQAQEPTNSAAAVLKPHIMLTPDEMKWEDCPPMIPAGAKCATIEGDRKAPNVPFTYRLKMPDNYRIAPHFHPADEHLTVISGAFNMALGEKFDLKTAKPMTAGSFMVMPKGTPHFAWTRGETILQVHAIGPWGLTYVNPKDNPRNK
jgi:mannose-6-phosphate isomerase-like protein (cupin superfamily)